MSMGVAPQPVLLLGPGAARVWREARAACEAGANAPATSATTWHIHEQPQDLSASPLWVEWQRSPNAVRALLLVTDATHPADLAEEDVFRHLLNAARLPFQALYPQAGRHLPALLRALGWAQPDPIPRRMRRACVDCLEPDCEHRLFHDLLAQRASAVTAAGPTLGAAAAD